MVTMNENKLYYYKCGLTLGSCDEEGKRKIIDFLKDDTIIRKKVKWISKTEYKIRLISYTIIGISLLPIYIVTRYLGKGFTWISHKICNFICNKLQC